MNTISHFYSSQFFLLPQGTGSRIRGSVERSYSHDISTLHFAEPTDVDHWDNMTLTSTRTFSCLLASTAFGDLLNACKKSWASLISWCALALFALSRIWKASLTPCSRWANHTARQAAGQPALPPRQLAGELDHMHSPCWWGRGCRARGVL